MMKVSKETFVMMACRELSSLKYGYRWTVMGCISAMRENKGIECDTPDDELCDAILEVMKKICTYESILTSIKTF